ncbi:MAG: MFS transporter [Parerythrobacter sp.]
MLGSSLAFIMGSIVNVALPTMQRTMALDAAGVQWIVNAYLLPLGAFVLVGGALGDHFGRKRVFRLGLLLFGLASLGCAIAPTFEALLAGRFAQGLGAALLAPTSLAILADAFSGEKRGKAIGTWAAAGAIGGAVAPVLGGLIVDYFDWRWAFALVILPAIAAWLIADGAIRESREAEEDRKPLDIAGAVLASAALASLVYALVALPSRGLTSLHVLPAGLVGFALAAVFLVVQYGKRGDAMMPLGIFASRSFTGISILTFLLYAALGGLLVVLPYMLIQAFDYTATQAGAAMLPFPAIMGLLSRRFGGLAQRIGVRITLTVGPVLVAAGFALFALRADPAMSYATGILPGLVVMALGMALSVAPLTTAVMNAVEHQFAGVASGINNAISRVAGLIATALLGPVLAGGAMVSGFTNASWIGAVLALAGAAAAFLLIREQAVAE